MITNPSTGAVVLSDILGRQTPIAWFEALAIVQSVCSIAAQADCSVETPNIFIQRDGGVIMGSSRPPTIEAPAEHSPIALDQSLTEFLTETDLPSRPKGKQDVFNERLRQLQSSRTTTRSVVAKSVDLPQPHAPAETVAAIGRLLGELLVATDTPVQLRLVVTEAASPTSRYLSIHDLSEALRFYERPGRQQLVRDVYERWQMMPVAAPHASPPAKADEPAARTAIVSLRSALVARASLVVTAILVPVGVAAIWLLFARDTTSSDGNRPPALRMAAQATLATAAQATKVVAEGIQAGAQAITDSLGIGTPHAAAAPAEPPESPRPPRRRLSRASQPTLSVQLRAFDVAGSRAPRLRAMLVDPDPANPVDASTPTPTDAYTYDGSDGTVASPVAVRPQLPSSLPSGVPVEDLGVMELVITEAGTVESVRLVAMPRRAIDVMMLSAAKNWRFQPAVKDGVPVRYRKRIWITF